MLKKLTVLLSLLCLSVLSRAQSYSIKGTVKDTLNQVSLQNASVSLIQRSDSVLIDFTRTNADGQFTLHATKPGKYFVLTSFPSFADYIDVVDVKSATTNAGVVPMTSRSHLLKEIVYTEQVAAIKIKGDTTEYMADSFKVKDGATVQDLLKRLPGIEVDKDGKVVAQGETVKKVLVDGEEFFSDDPGVVIKGLQAKAVEKVQVYDKKSDQAEFTGIDDGQTTKTINLELKDKMKKGYFGKVDAGGGTGGYFNDEVMANAFRNKQQISVFGIMSNNGTTGLGWNDREKYGSGNGTTTINDDGDIVTTYVSNGSDDFDSWDGTYSGQGQPKVWTGGAHYANKWNKDKDHINANYRYSKQNVEINSNTITQYVLPGDSQYVSQDHKDQFSTGQRQAINGTYEHKIDSLSDIKISLDAGKQEMQTASVYYSENLTTNNDTINNNKRVITTDKNSMYINSDLIYRKKFHKKGRTISADIKENYTDSKSDGHLNANNFIQLPVYSSYVIDQRKDDYTNKLAFETKLTYTEPLVSEKLFLVLNYGLAVNNSEAQNNSYNKPAGLDTYNVLDSTYSSDYVYNILTNSGGANLRYVHKKVNLSLGSEVSNSSYKQIDNYRHSNYDYSYLNFFPKASFRYKLNRMKSLRFNYYGNTRQPTIDQVQPLKQNTDPYNISIGNPNLKQEFDNRFSVSYNNYQALSGTYLWTSISFNASKDAISQSITTDLTGRRTYQYINVNGNYNGWGYISYGKRIEKLDMRVGLNANVNTNHTNNYVNGIKNVSNNNGYTLGFGIYKDKSKKYSISLSPSVTYNYNKATISTYTTSYWTGNISCDGYVSLPLKFEIGSDVTWSLRQQTTIFNKNNNVIQWNGYVSKKFLKNSQLEVKAYVFDILGQNIGYSRSGTDNYITENTYNTISRYGMLSVVWNFTKTIVGSGKSSTTQTDNTNNDQ